MRSKTSNNQKDATDAHTRPAAPNRGQGDAKPPAPKETVTARNATKREEATSIDTEPEEVMCSNTEFEEPRRSNAIDETDKRSAIAERTNEVAVSAWTTSKT